VAYLSHTRRRSPKDGSYYWKEEELAKLRTLAADGTATRQIALRLGRSPKAVRSKASELGIPLLQYGRELRHRYPDPAGERTRHKRTRIVVTTDFDFRTLTYDQRLALAEALRTSVPAGYVHRGDDVRLEELSAQVMAQRAGIELPGFAPFPAVEEEDPAIVMPEIDENGELDFRHMDAAQIRAALGIPLAPTPPAAPAPERYVPLRFRPRVQRGGAAKEGRDERAKERAGRNSRNGTSVINPASDPTIDLTLRKVSGF